MSNLRIRAKSRFIETMEQEMLRYLTYDRLSDFPKLSETMFRDRAKIFGERLGWNVQIDEHSRELDQYDQATAIYIIWERQDGSHGGSVRLTPTLGPSMINEHFQDLIEDRQIRDPKTWESTRFCSSYGSSRRIAAALGLGMLEFCLNKDVTNVVGVFGGSMIRVYRLIGWIPNVIGSGLVHGEETCAGIWHVGENIRPGLLLKSKINNDLVTYWYDWSGIGAISLIDTSIKEAAGV